MRNFLIVVVFLGMFIDRGEGARLPEKLANPEYEVLYQVGKLDFLIVASPRTRSNLLASLINDHLNITCADELLVPAIEKKWNQPLQRRGVSVDYHHFVEAPGSWPVWLNEQLRRPSNYPLSREELLKGFRTAFKYGWYQPFSPPTESSFLARHVDQLFGFRVFPGVHFTGINFTDYFLPHLTYKHHLLLSDRHKERDHLLSHQELAPANENHDQKMKIIHLVRTPFFMSALSIVELYFHGEKVIDDKSNDQDFTNMKSLKLQTSQIVVAAIMKQAMEYCKIATTVTEDLNRAEQVGFISLLRLDSDDLVLRTTEQLETIWRFLTDSPLPPFHLKSNSNEPASKHQQGRSALNFKSRFLSFFAARQAFLSASILLPSENPCSAIIKAEIEQLFL